MATTKANRQTQSSARLLWSVKTGNINLCSTRQRVACREAPRVGVEAGAAALPVSAMGENGVAPELRRGGGGALPLAVGNGKTRNPGEGAPPLPPGLPLPVPPAPLGPPPPATRSCCWYALAPGPGENKLTFVPPCHSTMPAVAGNTISVHSWMGLCELARRRSACCCSAAWCTRLLAPSTGGQGPAVPPPSGTPTSSPPLPVGP